MIGRRYPAFLAGHGRSARGPGHRRGGGHPDATPALLEHLSRHGPPARKAFREIARHRRATAAALPARLADERARPFAAGHPSPPPEVITDLLTDPDPQAAEAAAANPSLPPAVLEKLTREPLP